jgi:hypothetical protein
VLRRRMSVRGSEIFIPDPDLDFYPFQIPVSGVKKYRIPDPDLQPWDCSGGE